MTKSKAFLLYIYSSFTLALFGLFLTNLAPLHAEATNAVKPKPNLKVLTYDSFASSWGPGPELKAMFENQCDCTLEYVTAGDGGSIINRLQLEKKNTKADVVLGFDSYLQQDAIDTNLFAPLTQEKKIDYNIPSSKFVMDNRLIAFDYGWFAFVFDTTKIKVMPKSMDEFLSSPQFEKQLVTEDPRLSTPGLGLLLSMKSMYGDKVNSKLPLLRKKTLTVTSGWSEAYALFTKGESTLVQSYTTSEIYHKIVEKESKYKAWLPSEGNLIQIELAGILSHSKEGRLGNSFLQFILTPKAQTIIATKNWMYPTIKNVPLPKDFLDSIRPIKSLSFDAKNVKDNRKIWTQEWLENFR